MTFVLASGFGVLSAARGLPQPGWQRSQGGLQSHCDSTMHRDAVGRQKRTKEFTYHACHVMAVHRHDLCNGSTSVGTATSACNSRCRQTHGHAPARVRTQQQLLSAGMAKSLCTPNTHPARQGKMSMEKRRAPCSWGGVPRGAVCSGMWDMQHPSAQRSTALSGQQQKHAVKTLRRVTTKDACRDAQRGASSSSKSRTTRQVVAMLLDWSSVPAQQQGDQQHPL